MKTVRRFCLVAAFALGLPAHAALLPNLTDQWWVPFESGWGAAVFHEGNTLFIDIFVYDANSNPVWFTSTAIFQGQLSAGDYLYTGDLIATTGAYYGLGAFPANGVTRTKVGTLTFDATATSGKLTYTVNGVTVNKTLSRQTIKTQDVSGMYYGGFIFEQSGCVPAALNGVTNQLATLQVGQIGSTVSIFAANVSGGSCNYSGTYTQDGHLGTLVGGFACTNGDNGPFTASEIEVTRSGINGQVNGRNLACNKFTGQLGGVRMTIN
ncbi:MAG: hypothetical protein ABI981_03255 [Betaproteobacteria bacterium]